MKLLDLIIPSRRKKYKIALSHAKSKGLGREFELSYGLFGNIEDALEDWDLLNDEYFKALEENGF